MTRFDGEWIRQASGGRWLRPPEANRPHSGFTIDSRSVARDSVFVAIVGATHDGHDFIAQAAAAGAGVVIVSRAVDLRSLPPTTGVLLVEETVVALQRLGAAHRRRLPALKVIAITGSAGKTTTRRILDAVLSTTLRGAQSPKSFNNHLGVPLTLLSARSDHHYLLVEIGMNAPGEIAALAALASPQIGVVTGVGRAHLAGLGSIDAVAREKTQLLRSLAPNGLAVANIDQPAILVHLAGIAPLVTYGLSSAAEHRVTHRRPAATPGASSLDSRLDSPLAPPREGCLRDSPAAVVGQDVTFDDSFSAWLGLPGEHNAVNALAAVLVARVLGLDDDAIRTGLAAIAPSEMRLEPTTIATSSETEPILLFNDAYNANPESVAASLMTFAEIAPAHRRRVVILGDMLELGADGPMLHREVGERIAAMAPRLLGGPGDRVVCVGSLMQHAAAALSERRGAQRGTVETIPTLGISELANLVESIAPGDVVLLKGSRGMALERIAAALRRRFAAPGAGAREGQRCSTT